MDEFKLIQRIIAMTPSRVFGGAVIGDDAAVFPVEKGKSLLLTTDMIVEGVDFRLGKDGASLEEVGRKALAVNLSDMAAMGGKPKGFVVGWGIPKKFLQAGVLAAARGISRLAAEFKTAWVGGDISRSKEFFISIALLGEAKKGRAVLRSGARRGDLIYVTGALGGSIAGKHLTFTPRLREGAFLAKQFRPAAMIDISDGFVQDLGHLLKASGCGAQVQLDRLPVSDAARKLAGKSQKAALKRALTDGEDFELLFTIPAQRVKRLEKAWRRKFPGVKLTQVGQTIQKTGSVAWHLNGKKLPGLWFQKTGFRHF